MSRGKGPLANHNAPWAKPDDQMNPRRTHHSTKKYDRSIEGQRTAGYSASAQVNKNASNARRRRRDREVAEEESGL